VVVVARPLNVARRSPPCSASASFSAFSASAFLLAAVHARHIRIALLFGHDRRHRCLSQWLRFDRWYSRWRTRRWCHVDARTDRVRDSAHAARSRRHRVYFRSARRRRRLSSDACPRTRWSFVRGFAGCAGHSRRDHNRQHGVGAHDALHCAIAARPITEARC